MQRRVKMTLPIVPQPPGVVAQVGALNVGALERCRHIPAVKTRGVVDEGHHVFRHAQILHDSRAHPTHGCQRHQPFFDTFWNEPKQRGVDEDVHLGRMRRTAENIQHIAHPVTHGVNQMKALFGNRGLVADVVQRIDHKINRHNIDPATFEPHRRHPGRQYLAHALDQFEEIVRTVNLVHLAGGAVTHHHCRPKHRPGHLAFLAHDFLALVLGLEVGVVVVFRLFKHVFTKHAFVQPCGCN